MPLRIHVYGTRGKTGLTRRVIELLRRNGVRTMGRTTGDEPILHEPDGTERRQRRLGPPNIHEYLSCLNKAADSGCQALVMECMALAPENVYAAGKILQPGQVLLTNTRPDHYESQGPTDADIVRTLALSMSPGSRVCALADAGVGVLTQRVERNGNALVLLEDAGAVFAPAQESVRLANCLAEDLGFAPLEQPAPTWPEFRHIRPAGPVGSTGDEQPGSFLFLDLFSANDVVSTAMLLQKAMDLLGEDARSLPLAAVLATRADRPLRTRAFADWLAVEKIFALCCPQGSHAPYAHGLLRAGGVPLLPGFSFAARPDKLVQSIRQAIGSSGGLVAGRTPVKAIAQPDASDVAVLPGEQTGGGQAGAGAALEQTSGSGMRISDVEFFLVGLGNAHGYGQRFRDYIAECAR